MRYEVKINGLSMISARLAGNCPQDGMRWKLMGSERNVYKLVDELSGHCG
jgi:hypothetical protein